MRKDEIEQPLKGRAILLTRARNQSAETAAQLEKLGAKVICCPTIEFVEPDSWEALDAAIDSLNSYDWIIFTSANGVRFFRARFLERGLSPEALCNILVGAIGPATSKALKEAEISVNLVAQDSKAEGALSALIEYLGGEANLEQLRFLVPRARIARDFLPDELRRLGAHVDVVESYQTIRPQQDGTAVTRLLEEGKIDAITFTSSSTVSNFASIVGAENLPRLLRGLVIACIGPITAATAAEYGLTLIEHTGVHTSDALVETLVRTLGSDAYERPDLK